MIKVFSKAVASDLSKGQALKAAQSILENDKIGFWQLPERRQLTQKAHEFGRALRKNGPRALLFGIGGSSLGPQFLCDLYGELGQVGVCDNVDPVYLEKLWGSPEQWKTGSVVITSKSGSTIETLAGVQRFHEFVKQAAPDWQKRALVISEPTRNPLTEWAHLRKVPVAEFPLDVGGRFSILSPVGMVFASFVGKNPEEFQTGAAWALKQEKMVAELIVQSRLSFERQEWITLFWSYSSMLKGFGAWMTQLWAESLGKKVTVDGEPAPRVSTPMWAIGATDQHSMLQQVMEGHRDKWVVIHKIKSLEVMGAIQGELEIPSLQVMKTKSLGRLLSAEASATAEALRSEGVSVMEVEMDDLSPKTIGALLMTWEWVVAGLGSSLRINPFDQPGVELGKRLALKILER